MQRKEYRFRSVAFQTTTWEQGDFAFVVNVFESQIPQLPIRKSPFRISINAAHQNFCLSCFGAHEEIAFSCPVSLLTHGVVTWFGQWNVSGSNMSFLGRSTNEHYEILQKYFIFLKQSWKHMLMWYGVASLSHRVESRCLWELSESKILLF